MNGIVVIVVDLGVVTSMISHISLAYQHNNTLHSKL